MHGFTSGFLCHFTACGIKPRGIKWQQRQISQGIHIWIQAESFSISHANCSMPPLNSESLFFHLHIHLHACAAAQVGCDLSPFPSSSGGKHRVCIEGRELGGWGQQESCGILPAEDNKPISYLQAENYRLNQEWYKYQLLICCAFRFFFLFFSLTDRDF